jgi:hypothetical protein
MSAAQRARWALQQAEAEKARAAAREELLAKGVAWDGSVVERVNELEDNTLELLQKRKAAQQIARGNEATKVVPTTVTSTSGPAKATAQLARGWEVIDLKSGRQLDQQTAAAWHVSSGCVTLVVPKSEKESDASEHLGIRLPASRAWKTLQDPKNGKLYYWNHLSNKVVWDLPLEAAGAAATTTDSIKQEVEESAAAAVEEETLVQEGKVNEPPSEGLATGFTMITMKKKRRKV